MRRYFAGAFLFLPIVSFAASRDCLMPASEAEVVRYFDALVDESALALSRQSRTHHDALHSEEPNLWHSRREEKEALTKCGVMLARGETKCRDLVASRPPPSRETQIIKNDVVRGVMLTSVALGAASGAMVTGAVFGTEPSLAGAMVGTSPGLMVGYCLALRMAAWERGAPEKEVEKSMQKLFWEPLRKRGIPVPRKNEDLWFQMRREGLPFSASAFENRKAILEQRKRLKERALIIADTIEGEDRLLAGHYRILAARADQAPKSRLPWAGALAPLRELIEDTADLHRDAHRIEVERGLDKKGLHILEAFPPPASTVEMDMALLSHDLWSNVHPHNYSSTETDLLKALGGRVWTSKLQQFVDDARKKGLHLTLAADLKVVRDAERDRNLPGMVRGQVELVLDNDEHVVDRVKFPIEFPGGQGADPIAGLRAGDFRDTFENEIDRALDRHGDPRPRRLAPAVPVGSNLNPGPCDEPLGTMFVNSSL